MYHIELSPCFFFTDKVLLNSNIHVYKEGFQIIMFYYSL